jgi:hypothetical protein
MFTGNILFITFGLAGLISGATLENDYGHPINNLGSSGYADDLSSRQRIGALPLGLWEAIKKHARSHQAAEIWIIFITTWLTIAAMAPEPGVANSTSPPVQTHHKVLGMRLEEQEDWLCLPASKKGL